MEIPYELLSLPENEIKKKLNVHKKRAQYVQKDGYLYEVIARRDNKGLVKRMSDKYVATVHDLCWWTPLTYAEFIEKKNEKLYSAPVRCSDENFKRFLNTVASEVFPPERYEIQDIIYDGLPTIALVVYYPEITISNSAELSHVMRDIYVRFLFVQKYGKRNYYGFQICRTTFTEAEYKAGYVFSHKDTTEVWKYSGSICLGNSPFSQAVKELERQNYGRLKLILLSLENYLSWESLEGTPYMYISKIHDKGFNPVDSDWGTRDGRVVFRNIKDSIPNLTYSFELKDGNYRVKLSQESIDLIDALASEKYDNCVYYIIDGKSFSTNFRREPITDRELNQMTEVVFKGEKKKINIILEEKKEEITYPRGLDRNLLNVTVQYIEDKFTDYIINKKLQETL